MLSLVHKPVYYAFASSAHACRLYVVDPVIGTLTCRTSGKSHFSALHSQLTCPKLKSSK